MNILIVDDNKNNRMILKLLLEDYMDENDNVKFFLDEAEDGKIAVDKCRDGDFDIVLMDIMMPNMDGIEATKIIREDDKKIMIIAISAVDDNHRKKLILNNGAEDYISKPVNADIFISRISNYITLIEARKNKKISSNGINVFSDEIFHRYMRFMINSEDSLSEFWEYFLLDAEHKCDNLSDVIRTIFALVDIQRRLNISSDIYVEDTEKLKYFTLMKVDEIPIKIVELTLKKNNFDGKYKIANGKISFELELKLEIIDEIVDEKPVIVEEEVASPLNFVTSTELQVFDYIESDDLVDLEEYAHKLNSIMLVVGGGDVTQDEVIEIYTHLEKIGSILSTYSEVYPISLALSSLSVDMSNYTQQFIENSEALGPMCKAFSNDMSKWIEQSFHTGASSVDFMNDTIIVNCKTISSMLKIDEEPLESEDDFDDIFDF